VTRSCILTSPGSPRCAGQDTTEIYGQVKAELARLGKPVPDNHLWIAATAMQYDLPLATRDAHFTHVPRLKTLAW
jgi:tRNA(fMet)-specific endonuclease VapC